MKLSQLFVWAAASVGVASQSIQGIIDLVQRRLPNNTGDFEFRLLESYSSPYAESATLDNDKYTVTSTSDGKILVEGSSVIALASGLHRYLTDVVHVDIWWYFGSRLDVAPLELPGLSESISGTSVVPWRYHFNTVTFSYTAAFWSWEDWELQLDWMALRGINLPLAWVGYEKLLVETFQEIGMTDAEISTYFSGPAFQAWNRFGNIQGSWGGELPTQWINDQFELQQKIVARMVQLGMTPVLPCFTGFVPQAISRVAPNATVVNGSQWSGFPVEYTNVTFLEPSNSLFTQLQKSFIAKQTAAYGNVTHIYTLDQYNENDPYSGDLDYLGNVSYNTWQSLKAADPDAIWLMQGWLFYSNSAFWTESRIEAYLGGVEDNNDMIILDLFSESEPQWQLLDSYYGKPWIWCQLHDYGGNMGLYGQIENVTINPIEAVANSSSLIGFGLTMEGQEGNEVMYDLLLDQAWSSSPIDTYEYFQNWVTRRYAGNNTVPSQIYQAWDMMRTTVYNNTNLTASTAVTKSIFELSPNITGLLNRTGHHATTLTYQPSTLIKVFNLMYNASDSSPSLWQNPAYEYDMIDISRQILSNAFNTYYTTLVNNYISSSNITAAGNQVLSLLSSIDKILLTSPYFSLSTRVDSATALADSNTTIADFYVYNARNQITLWGPTGQISDYASKSWGGLVSSYYVPRWETFINYLSNVTVDNYNVTTLNAQLLEFEEAWQTQSSGVNVTAGPISLGLQSLLTEVKGQFQDAF